MQFISGCSDHSAQMESLIEQQQGLSLGAFVCFFFAYESLYLLGQ